MPTFVRLLLEACRDLAPIVIVIGFFQLVVLRQPFPDPGGLLLGMAAVLVGLAFFVHGLELSLFPIGENLAGEFARKGSLVLLLLFAFGLGFGTTVAEPALIAVADEAARIKALAGAIADDIGQQRYADSLRYTVALAVGCSLVVGVMRILLGWPIQWFIIGGYCMVVTLTRFAPDDIIGVAYDSGGVTTSTITVPLVTALGIGLATVIKGRNPLIDGFGLIAFASLFPIIFVLVFGMVV